MFGMLTWIWSIVVDDEVSVPVDHRQAGLFSIVSVKFKALPPAEETTQRDIAARGAAPAMEVIGP
jgi:hypothetical protein